MNQRFTNEQIEPRDDLVKSARTDREAFGELFDYFYPIVFAYCVRRLVVRAVAENIASEVHYAGANARLGERDRPIFWYKPIGSEAYRVIYADLSVRDTNEAPKIPDAIRVAN